MITTYQTNFLIVYYQDDAIPRFLVRNHIIAILSINKFTKINHRLYLIEIYEELEKKIVTTNYENYGNFN